ncbi:hypothetical protein IFM89_000175 [Coptis chinensis]|uniref:DNA2/NAM7 helicase-like C-terminal domain-containing protein n=1 Tax=Coptis chinensis TaxID=261450 RepID=A0A835M117_9MAGN|nr:hypothetical protein IFM89_000175 [Coptis chinensis]
MQEMVTEFLESGHMIDGKGCTYRMHPEICKFPSLHFYDNKLLNGDQMTSKVAPFHENKYLGPYIFFDVSDGQESHGKNSGAMSLCNESEAAAAVELLRFFSKRYPSEFVGGRIGIISPYKSQVSLLRSRFSSAFGPSVTADVEFNTVDGFQGREVDILILSTVRASDLSSSTGVNSSIIGFVADVRRMNVALTRAKLSLWILGNAKTLRTNQNWSALIKNAMERSLIKTMVRPYESMFKKSSSASRRKEESISGSDSKPSNLGEMVKDTSKYRGQTGELAKGTVERKTKNLKNDVGKDKIKLKADGRDNKSISSDVLHDEPLKENEPSKDLGPSMTTGNVLNGQGKRKEVDAKRVKMSSAVPAAKGKVVSEKSGTDTTPVHIQLEIDVSTKTINPNRSEGAAESSEQDMEKHKSAISLSCTESNHDEEVNNGFQTTNIMDTSEDLIMTRKRQRDAVDALLPSAFISTKKQENLSKSKSVKRPLSPKMAPTVGTKPPKPRNGKFLIHV